MGCSSCSSGTDGAPKGCGSKGNCSTSGCNRLNTFDWLSHISLPDYGNYDLVEVSFKKGARKEIFKKPNFVQISTGDFVAVESAASGYDIGRVSLMGELVSLQLKKHRIKDNAVLPNILRVANERDLERLADARQSEREAMIKARVIVRDLGLEMKIGDVEYQGDKRKITFYYTADGRIDFRELIRIFAREYRVKIEMRQIGARQESARIGGIGSCGRELCCSTWLTNFKSVSTVAARYQNLAINQSKLSGQCGRLKCCLNYELNTYLEVLKEFPQNINSIKTQKGSATLIKTDIFKRLMYFAYRTEFGITEIQALSIEQVKDLHERAKQGNLPENLKDITPSLNLDIEEEEIGFVDGAGSLELKQLDKKKRSRNRRSRNKNNQNKRKDNADSTDKKITNKSSNAAKNSSKKTNTRGGSQATPNKKKSSRNRSKRGNNTSTKEHSPNTNNKGGDVNKSGNKNSRSRNKTNNPTPKDKVTGNTSSNKKRSSHKNRNRRKKIGQKPPQDKSNVSSNKKD